MSNSYRNMIKKAYLLSGLMFVLFVAKPLAQELTWQTTFDFFFDNTEFAQSSYTDDQTMAGVNLAQFVGRSFDTNHQVMLGVEGSKYLGTPEIIDKVHVMAYYQYNDDKTLFKAGSFHRADLLADYSDFFFQDSIGFYKRTIDGLYVKRGNANSNFKFWLDWVGLQSEVDREAFYMGLSAYHQLKPHFYADFQSYVFHYANTHPSSANLSVCDNILAQISFGYKRHKNDRMYDVSLGVLSGFERDRKAMDTYYTPTGFVAELQAEYKWIGTENLLYAGQNRMALYNSLGHQFYWGNPFLRGDFYWQNKIYFKVLDTKYVQGQLAFRNHLSEGKLHLEQLFTLKAQLSKY